MTTEHDDSAQDPARASDSGQVDQLGDETEPVTSDDSRALNELMFGSRFDRDSYAELRGRLLASFGEKGWTVRLSDDFSDFLSKGPVLAYSMPPALWMHPKAGQVIVKVFATPSSSCAVCTELRGTGREPRGRAFAEVEDALQHAESEVEAHDCCSGAEGTWSWLTDQFEMRWSRV